MAEPVPTNDEIRDSIARSAEEGIDSVTVDGMTVKEMALSARLDALEQLETTSAASKAHRGLRFTRLVPAPPG